MILLTVDKSSYPGTATPWWPGRTDITAGAAMTHFKQGFMCAESSSQGLHLPFDTLLPVKQEVYFHSFFCLLNCLCVEWTNYCSWSVFFHSTYVCCKYCKYLVLYFIVFIDNVERFTSGWWSVSTINKCGTNQHGGGVGLRFVWERWEWQSQGTPE